ncbi:MAG: hypothetical protein K1X67_05560 [Fimbriimonadaceae bacterium]|nr:hypothetical protein [Fimbriimonadaceae bacterium]
MNKKLAIRLAVGLFLMAGLIFAYVWFRGVGADLVGKFAGATNTAGWIAAIERREDGGSQAVVFWPDGAKIDSADYKPDSEDQGVVWRPDGKFIFFSSNRVSPTFDIFRWDPDRNLVERRTFGSRGKSNLWFGPPGDPAANDDALIMAGGFVMTLDPSSGATRQVLPPPTGEVAGSGEEGGSGSQFDLIYSRLGKSFKEAKWGKNRESIIAVMIRESGEQVLLLQSMLPVKDKDGNERVAPPVAVAAGERIEFDVAESGDVVFTTMGFAFPDPQMIPPEYLKEGKAVKPYQNALSFFNPAKPEQGVKNIVVSPNVEEVIIQPRISPDSQRVLCIAGNLKDTGEIEPVMMLTCPLKENGASESRPVVQGEAREASWSPNGDKIVFIKRGPKGNRAIFTVSTDGTGEKEISGAKGDYAWPQFSPKKGS